VRASATEYEKHLGERRTLVTLEAWVPAGEREHLVEILETLAGVERVRIEALGAPGGRGRAGESGRSTRPGMILPLAVSGSIIGVVVAELMGCRRQPPSGRQQARGAGSMLRPPPGQRPPLRPWADERGADGLNGSRATVDCDSARRSENPASTPPAKPTRAVPMVACTTGTSPISSTETLGTSRREAAARTVVNHRLRLAGRPE